jgi:hypothetical protein
MLSGQRQSPHDCHAPKQFIADSIFVARASDERELIADI